MEQALWPGLIQLRRIFARPWLERDILLLRLAAAVLAVAGAPRDLFFLCFSPTVLAAAAGRSSGLRHDGWYRWK